MNDAENANCPDNSRNEFGQITSSKVQQQPRNRSQALTYRNTNVDKSNDGERDEPCDEDGKDGGKSSEQEGQESSSSAAARWLPTNVAANFTVYCDENNAAAVTPNKSQCSKENEPPPNTDEDEKQEKEQAEAAPNSTPSLIRHVRRRPLATLSQASGSERTSPSNGSPENDDEDKEEKDEETGDDSDDDIHDRSTFMSGFARRRSSSYLADERNADGAIAAEDDERSMVSDEAERGSDASESDLEGASDEAESDLEGAFDEAGSDDEGPIESGSDQEAPDEAEYDREVSPGVAEGLGADDDDNEHFERRSRNLAYLETPPGSPNSDSSSRLYTVAEHEDPVRLDPIYGRNLYDYMRYRELRLFPRVDFVTFQEEINAQMRYLVVDWLSDASREFELSTDCIHVAVSIIDRILEVMQIPRMQLQLLGAAALVLATKCEEIFPPTVQEIARITDDTFDVHELIQMERIVFVRINYHVTVPTPWWFASRLMRMAHLPRRIYCLVRYLLELTLLDHTFLIYRPSVVGTASFYLSNVIFQSAYNRYLTGTDIGVAELRPPARRMLRLFHRIPDNEYRGVFEKYAAQKFEQISLLPVRSNYAELEDQDDDE